MKVSETGHAGYRWKAYYNSEQCYSMSFCAPTPKFSVNRVFVSAVWSKVFPSGHNKRKFLFLNKIFIFWVRLKAKQMQKHVYLNKFFRSFCEIFPKMGMTLRKLKKADQVLSRVLPNFWIFASSGHQKMTHFSNFYKTTCKNA